jgi:hypothetical protein
MTSAASSTQLRIPGQSVPWAALPVRIALVPLLVIAVLWGFSPLPIDLVAVACSFILVLLPWWSYCVWQGGDQRRFPLFPAISIMYVLAYVLPLYLGEHLGRTSFGPRVLSPDAIDNTMLLVVEGVLALGVGLSVRIPDRFATQWKLEFQDKPVAWNYVRLVFLATAVFTTIFGIGTLGQGGRQALVDLEGVVGMAAFLALFRCYLWGRSERLDRIMLIGFVIMRLGRGVASGWLGAAVWFVLVTGIGYFDVRRRVPKAIIVGLVLIILFLQPGKTEFRKRYWHGIGNTVGTTSERATFWLSSSVRAWSEALERPEKRTELFGETVTRASLFEPTAMVVQMTPVQVPYQNGRLYKYLAISLIPRAIWPDKPTFSEANQFYQVAYGVTDRRDLNKVSMAVGTLAESYINFGWFGPLFVMLIIGLLLNFIRRYFLDAEQGEFLRCLGIALLPNLMIVEGQAAQYLGGIIQGVFLTIVIFMPALHLANYSSKSRPGLHPTKEIV